MAIKLDVYLKRTEQTLESWLSDNGISDVSEMAPRCAYLGLAASLEDQAMAQRILETKKHAGSVPEPEAEKKQRKKTSKVVDSIPDPES